MVVWRGKGEGEKSEKEWKEGERQKGGQDRVRERFKERTLLTLSLTVSASVKFLLCRPYEVETGLSIVVGAEMSH